MLITSILKGKTMKNKTNTEEKQNDWIMFMEMLKKLAKNREDGNIKRHAKGLLIALTLR